MSTPKIDNDTLRVNSEEAADDLLAAAAERVAELIESLPAAQVEALSKRPMLVAVHAVLQLLDRRSEQNDQRAQSAADLVPSAIESELMFGILKADWLKHHTEHTEKEYREAMLRFEILAGL